MEIIESSCIGTEVARGGHALVVGISINNSYFKKDTLEKLLLWSSSNARTVYIMIPDEPAVYTLIALGKEKTEAERIARLKSNALENKCKEIISQYGLSTIQIIRWKDFAGREEYRISLSDIQRAYASDTSFTEAVRRTTTVVLRNGSQDEPSKESLETGTQFLLQELAFISRSSRILGEGKVAYVYHKTMKVLKDILACSYSFVPDHTVGFITAE